MHILMTQHCFTLQAEVQQALINELLGTAPPAAVEGE